MQVYHKVTVLGPILFLIFIHDLSLILENSIKPTYPLPSFPFYSPPTSSLPLFTSLKHYYAHSSLLYEGWPGLYYNPSFLLFALFYADDLVLIPPLPDLPSLSFSSLNFTLQSSLNKLYDWSLVNFMKINLPKTNIVLFRTSCSLSSLTPIHQYSLGSSPISIVSSYKYLGLIFHEKLKWKEQYEHVKKKATLATGLILRVISTHIHPHIISLLTLLTVRSILSYALPFYPLTSTQILSLNNLLSRPLKRCLGLPLSTHGLSVLIEFGIPDLYTTQIFQTLSYYQRLLRNGQTFIELSQPLPFVTYDLISSHHQNMAFSQLRYISNPKTPSLSRQYQLSHKSILPLTRLFFHTQDTHQSPSDYKKYHHTHLSSFSPYSFTLCPFYSSNFAAFPSRQMKKECLKYAHEYWLKHPSDQSSSSILTSIHSSLQISSLQPAYYHRHNELSSLKLRARLRHNRAIFGLTRYNWFHKKDPSLSPYCPHCHITETPFHTLLYCPLTSHIRSQFISSLNQLSRKAALSLSKPFRPFHHFYHKLKLIHILAPCLSHFIPPDHDLTQKLLSFTSTYLSQVYTIRPY